MFTRPDDDICPPALTHRHHHCGIFGGTFDPIHLGHTSAIRQLIKPAGLDEVRFIPVAVPPHRRSPEAGQSDRLNMVRIGLSDEPDMSVDSSEIDRGGKSFTVDTVKMLSAEMPGSRFSLILGLDAALGLDRWHRWEELLSLVTVITMIRPGWPLPKEMPSWWQDDVSTSDSTGTIQLMTISPMDISATRIRACLHRQEDVRHLLHPDVHAYIRNRCLYSSTSEPECPA